METHGVDINAPDVGNLCAKFNLFENPYAGIETERKQATYMVENLMLVKPIQIALGTRFEQAVERKTGEIVQKVVTDSFQYIPVAEVIKLILSQPIVRELIENEEHSPENFLRGFQDGTLYKQSGFFKEHPCALRLQLYYDDVEVTNPLGSKTGVHKLAMFYYSIQNLPRRFNCTASSIHLLAACYYQDVAKYGFEPILAPFIEEMKHFESDDGVQLMIDGRMINIHGSLVSYSADSLAAHALLGFMSPSANKLCRLCYASRDDIQNYFLEDDFELRTIDSHDLDAEEASRQGFRDPRTGVRSYCPLNTLRNFHSATNFNLDIMHDMLEGVCPYEIKLLLHQFIYVDHFITVEDFNQRLKAFHFPFNDRKNKPSAVMPDRLRNIADHKLGQKAVQMWCLTRMLPLLIGSRVPYNNEYYELLLLLLRCMDIIFAPVISTSHTVYLKHLIMEHHAQFKLKFPGQRFINKQHHMVHYPTCIRMSGPLTTLQCLKYEMKHSFSKKIAAINCNFKNICQSVTLKHQIMQCAVWSGSGLRLDFECAGGNLTSIDSLAGSRVIAEHLQVAEDTEIFEARQVSLFGTDYKPKLFLATDMVEDIPQFGRICSILVRAQTPESVYFVVQKWRNKGFSPHFHAYAVTNLDNPEFSIVQLESLLDFHPLSGLTSYEQHSPLYLCPRYTLSQNN
ncbi:uncharacterized protein [Apostichopus japonicus]